MFEKAKPGLPAFLTTDYRFHLFRDPNGYVVELTAKNHDEIVFANNPKHGKF